MFLSRYQRRFVWRANTVADSNNYTKVLDYDAWDWHLGSDPKQLKGYSPDRYMVGSVRAPMHYAPKNNAAKAPYARTAALADPHPTLWSAYLFTVPFAPHLRRVVIADMQHQTLRDAVIWLETSAMMCGVSQSREFADNSVGGVARRKPVPSDVWEYTDGHTLMTMKASNYIAYSWQAKCVAAGNNDMPTPNPSDFGYVTRHTWQDVERCVNT